MTQGNPSSIIARPQRTRAIGTRRAVSLTLALFLALGWQLTPPSAQPVAAACTTSSCATLEIVFGSGAGSGLVTTFPSGMDCEWTGSARAGACVVQYDVGGGLDVTLYLDPGPHSYACYGNTCAGLETRLERTVHLDAGDNIDVFPIFNLGVRATVEMSMGGTGDGRVTSVPAGLNCRWLDGAKSGTCRADFYFYPAASYTIQIHRTPDNGSFACSGDPPFCGVPNQVYSSTTGVSPDYLSGPPANFFEAKPVAVTVSGSGSLVSDPAGISCPGTCSVWLPPNYSDDPPRYTRLIASPSDGWFIKDWSGACDGTIGATCQFFNYVNGATAGVVFGQTSTPKPPSTPRITSRPTVTPRPSTPAASTKAPVSAGPTAAAAPGPSTDPGTSIGPASAEPAGSPNAPGTSGPPLPPPTAAGEPGAPDGTDGPFAGGPPAGSTVPGGSAATGGLDALLLLGLGLLGLAVLVLGFLVGRRSPVTTRR